MSAESGGESALVLGPAIPASETTDCLDLFDVSGAASVLHVDYVRSPEWRLRQWSSADRPQLERLGILRVGWRGNAVRPVERLGSTLDVDVDVRTDRISEELAASSADYTELTGRFVDVEMRVEYADVTVRTRMEMEDDYPLMKLVAVEE